MSVVDYGHELEFGSFITPANHDPAGEVALAEHSEVVGLDLVTFQDHPYQPSFLDSWTLLSFVAGRTERVKLEIGRASCRVKEERVFLARSTVKVCLSAIVKCT